MSNSTCPVPECKIERPLDESVGSLSSHFKAFHSSVLFCCYLCTKAYSDQRVLFVHMTSHGVPKEEIRKKKIALFDKAKQQRIGYLQCEEAGASVPDAIPAQLPQRPPAPRKAPAPRHAPGHRPLPRAHIPNVVIVLYNLIIQTSINIRT